MVWYLFCVSANWAQISTCEISGGFFQLRFGVIQFFVDNFQLTVEAADVAFNFGLKDAGQALKITLQLMK